MGKKEFFADLICEQIGIETEDSSKAVQVVQELGFYWEARADRWHPLPRASRRWKLEIGKIQRIGGPTKKRENAQEEIAQTLTDEDLADAAAKAAEWEDVPEPEKKKKGRK
jgi:hypothetical protein